MTAGMAAESREKHMPFTVYISGSSAAVTACVLTARLGKIQEYDTVRVEVSADIIAEPSPDTMCYATDACDSPEFSAEKILDLLADRNLIRLERGALTDDEESRLRERLRDLGYLE